jgi:hypothetical protein
MDLVIMDLPWLYAVSALSPVKSPDYYTCISSLTPSVLESPLP